MGVVGGADKSGHAALDPNFFEHFTQRALLEGLTLIELALGKGPVTAGFAINAGQLNSAARDHTDNDAARCADEVVGRITGDNQFTTQKMHATNARG